MATKKTKKFVPTITVDLTNCVDASDVYYAFAAAKAKKYMTKTEIDSFIDHNKEYVYIVQYKCATCTEKKPNIFKRFWRWLTK